MKKRTLKKFIALIAVIAMAAAMTSVVFAASSAVAKGTFTLGGYSGYYIGSVSCTKTTANATLTVSNYSGSVEYEGAAIGGGIYGTKKGEADTLIERFKDEDFTHYYCKSYVKDADVSGVTDIYTQASFKFNQVLATRTVYPD